ncbi:hypothetical protein, variant 1 [Aphanomyces invadans]|uniref:Prolyl 4-hydroxylase alpha subunit domain-containing protein n=1 Tax=Aphanomyces invadans TaxID=157072 RepID=A0A024TH52_9STRA|nr:hypothetical protein, variant 1 [Aphanomyces invadans]ETV93480.1 hypothetical protein, variant 1 [Aphanomyces invadans]|eukprot:XP_008877822.1 hypothetical protein, variant 1 [Aphanomyces invadans]
MARPAKAAPTATPPSKTKAAMPTRGAPRMSSPRVFWSLAVVFGALAAWLRYQALMATKSLHHIGLPTSAAPARIRWNVTCSNQYKPFVQGCHKRTKCGRALKDNFVSPAVVDALRGIADHGMQGRSTLGGPTIMDINTGYVKDGNGLINLYRQDPPVQFTTAQYTLYRDTIEAIRRAIMHEFQLTTLYFTAPTFLTRLIGNASWTPAELHDEHAHVDKNNTHHYDYSGLLYLADYGVEFTGGMFAFLDHHRNTTVEPARGRLMMFTSGAENVHEVRPVESGARYLMSMWFTCDARKRFHNFLDGKVHEHYASAT